MSRFDRSNNKPVFVLLLLALIMAFSVVPATESRADSPEQATFYVH